MTHSTGSGQSATTPQASFEQPDASHVESAAGAAAGCAGKAIGLLILLGAAATAGIAALFWLAFLK